MAEKKWILILAVVVAVTLSVVFLAAEQYGRGREGDIVPAPLFSALDHLNRSFSLDDFAGNVTILHVTQLESPVCIECEEHMSAQIEELEGLVGEEGVKVVTLNIRKNDYSEAGWELARDWYGINVTWFWVEEAEPYPVSSLYQEYWEVGGSFANPSLIMIGPDTEVMGVYHVYALGSGELAGVQTTESLIDDAERIMSGEWNAFVGGISGGVTFGGMFLLGIVTSFSPCSILLLLTMISYIGSLKDEEDSPGEDWKRGLWIGLCFTLGMSLVFLVFGLLISYVGLFIEMSAAFYLIAGALLVILGINAIRPLRELLPRSREEAATEKPRGKLIEKLAGRSVYLTSFLLGILFSVGWAPCAVTLVFPVVVLMLTQNFSLLTGGLLMFVFGLGHGIVVIPFCVATGETKGRIGNRFVEASRWVQMIFGAAIIAIGIVFAVRFWGFNLW